MSSDLLPFLDRTLHQRLPHPLSQLYRKTCNSETGKDLHDNACYFGLCLLRTLTALAIALWRDQGLGLSPGDEELMVKFRRPSDGLWLQWLTRALARLRPLSLPPDSLGAWLEGYVYEKRDVDRSELAASLGHLLSFLEKKPIVRTQASVFEFLDTLVRYRNATIGHGAVLTEDVNQANGAAVLKGTEAMLRAAVPWGGWELKYSGQVNLDATAVTCRFINLTGPDWMREPPVSYPRGYPAPLPSHVVLTSASAGERHLDLHPLLLFQKGVVVYFNGFKGRSPTYLDYAAGDLFRMDELEQDYADWETALGAHAPGGGRTGAIHRTDADATEPGIEVLPSSQRFRQERLLGRGGMGEVWLAYDETLKRNVALKRIRRELLDHPDAHRRFLQEARNVARLSHPNIVPILTIDSDAQGPYLILEYLEGGSLRGRLELGSLPLQEALAYVRQLLQGLHHAHEQGVIHRDVKPENILLTRAGMPKLADFGLAWMLQHETGDPAAPGEGTRAYLAPEVASDSDTPGPRTDLYALGVTFYEMLTGLPPSPVREHKVPSTVLPILRKMIHPNPNLRFATAQECLSECLELERSLELAARTDEETQERIRRTLENAYSLLGQRKLVDARAALERVQAEEPDNPRAATGILLVTLFSGDMPESAGRYRTLLAADCRDAGFLQLRGFFEGLSRPTVLEITPRPVPFSYSIGALREGHLVKDLADFGPNHLNLGDVGELLIELAQRTAAGFTIHYAPGANGSHGLRFSVDDIRIECTYRFHVRTRFLRPAELAGIHLSLSIDAEPFEIYRLVRYLTHRLAQTYKRGPGDWIDPVQAAHFGRDPTAAWNCWQRLSTDFLEAALERKR